MSETVLISLIGIGGATLSAFITWLFSRRKYEVDVEKLRLEVKSSSLDNEEKRFKIYNDFLSNYEELIRKSQELNEALTNKIFEQDKKIYDLLLTINKLESEIITLRETINRLTGKSKNRLSMTINKDENNIKKTL